MHIPPSPTIANDPPSSDSIPFINVQHPTAPNVPARRQPGLSPRASPQLTGVTLSPRGSTIPPPEEFILQPGSQPYDLPDPLSGILTKIKRIGGGAYGNVYQGVWALPGKDPIRVAIKCIERRTWTRTILKPSRRASGGVPRKIQPSGRR